MARMHEHQLRIRRAQELGVIPIRPTLTHDINVYHDVWCMFNTGGKCDCDPQIMVTERRSMCSFELTEDGEKTNICLAH